ncbi:MAG TPA: DNA-binding protein [Candidatus Omnitrophica bacterium]|nr:DNA-binding protein [Candidatus Omnitrophota bacterium]
MTIEQLAYRPLEAAEALGVGRSAIYELIKQPGFPVVRIGRSVRISKKALAEWVERQAKSQAS